MSCSLACCGGTACSEDRVRGFLRNVITYPWCYTVLHRRRTQSWYTAPWEPKILVIFMFFSHLITVLPSRLTDNCGCISSWVLNLTLDWAEWSAARFGRFIIRGNLYILWVGGWHCLSERGAGINTRALTRNGIPVVHPLASHYTDWAISIHVLNPYGVE